MQLSQTKKMMHLTLFLALSIILHYFDPDTNVLGVKLGIANIVGVLVVKWYDAKSMILVNILRVLLVSLVKGTLFAIPFWTSLAGVGLSTIMVIIINKLFNPSMLMLSVVSAIFHPIGQILVIIKIYALSEVLLMLPLIMILSILTGIFTGIVAEQVEKRIRRS